jgi:putative endopeptidase
MTPQSIDAVNLPLNNALDFPAAILQPPFFDPKATAAANYGVMGAVIGHEISHTFDNIGSAFDAQGRLRNWWTKEDFAHFDAETTKLVAQYDAYKPFPDLSLNGKQTLPENLADVARTGRILRCLQGLGPASNRSAPGRIHGRPGIFSRLWAVVGRKVE